MSQHHLAAAFQQLQDAVAAINSYASSGECSGADALTVIRAAEGASRMLDHSMVTAIGKARREGVFTERGPRSAPAVLHDLVGWDRAESRRKVAVAEQVCPQIRLDGTALPVRMPATAARFAAGQISLAHVETLAAGLDTPAARRIDPDWWAEAEEDLAALAPSYSPSGLRKLVHDRVELLDQDGAEPADDPPERVNELRITPRRDGGGSITARYDDPVMFAAVRALIEANSAPVTGDDRSQPQRQAQALAEICGYVLDNADIVRRTGGHRPHLMVTVKLEDLQRRLRGAFLDFGGRITATDLRILACDADVLPIVLDGAGQPLDVGRKRRIVPEPLRRAIAARDKGCAHPGCDRPPSWCEVHHIIPWEHGGCTDRDNLVMLCRFHHRQLHETEWECRIVIGTPEFVPPAYVDPLRRPLPQLARNVRR